MSVEIIKSKIRDVVDFPQKGIVFRDLTTVFKDADCLRELSDMLTAIYAEKGITSVENWQQTYRREHRVRSVEVRHIRKRHIVTELL